MGAVLGTKYKVRLLARFPKVRWVWTVDYTTLFSSKGHFLDPEHFVKGSYNVAFFFRSRRVTLLLPMLLVVYT